MAGTIRYLEENLGLPVNKEKSLTSEEKYVPFLGFQILRGKIRVSDKARTKFKYRVRELTRRNNPLSMQEAIDKLNKYLDGWIRSRLRSMQLKKWKKPRKFQRMMIRADFDPEQARRTLVKMNKWQSVNRTAVRFVLNLGWFRRQGLTFLHDFTYATLELPFGR